MFGLLGGLKCATVDFLSNPPHSALKFRGWTCWWFWVNAYHIIKLQCRTTQRSMLWVQPKRVRVSCPGNIYNASKSRCFEQRTNPIEPVTSQLQNVVFVSEVLQEIQKTWLKILWVWKQCIQVKSAAHPWVHLNSREQRQSACAFLSCCKSKTQLWAHQSQKCMSAWLPGGLVRHFKYG